MGDSQYFTQKTFAFLKDLAEHNDRAWFEANKTRYESAVRDPALRFIADFAKPLAGISRAFRADPRPIGGSLFRIYRDTRFSKDKSPYKTHTGIQFRHGSGKDVHAPGFYLHLQPGQIFAGVGIWHPDGAALGKIRDAIVEEPAGWKRAVQSKSFRGRFELAGESLSRPPKGYDAEHPLIEDLKRKDFMGIAHLDQKTVTGPRFIGEFARVCRSGAPLVRFLCGALELAF